VPAVLGNRVVFRDGVPLGSLESGNLAHRASLDDATLLKPQSLLHPPLKTPSRSRVGSPAA